MNSPCVTAGASFLDAFKGLCYVPDMQKVRQPAGTALMILAFPAAIYGAFPWGIVLGAFLFLLGVVLFLITMIINFSVEYISSKTGAGFGRKS